MSQTAFRIARKDKELWVAVAAVEGVSQSQFVRRAIRDRVRVILDEPKSRHRTSNSTSWPQTRAGTGDE